LAGFENHSGWFLLFVPVVTTADSIIGGRQDGPFPAFKSKDRANGKSWNRLCPHPHGHVDPRSIIATGVRKRLRPFIHAACWMGLHNWLQAVMGDSWLTDDFWFLGLHLQHWMLIALAIVVAAILYTLRNRG
jgi:hypothetical protein